jgi:hypothetical protein
VAARRQSATTWIHVGSRSPPGGRPPGRARGATVVPVARNVAQHRRPVARCHASRRAFGPDVRTPRGHSTCRRQPPKTPADGGTETSNRVWSSSYAMHSPQCSDPRR